MAINAGGLVTATEFAVHDWTPVIGTGLTALGAGTSSTGWYTTRNGIVTAEFYFLFAGSPVFASTIALNLPVAADADGIQAAMGSWVFRDTSVPYHYAGTLAIWSGGATSVSFSGAWDGTAPRSRITHTVPFTVAATDILSGKLSYRSA